VRLVSAPSSDDLEGQLSDTAQHVGSSASSKLAVCATALALGSYLAVLISYRLASFPALHGDEAYFGLAALDLLAHGLQSPHAVNYYTGPIQAAWVALLFSTLGPSVGVLRMSALLANGAAWLAWLWIRWHRNGVGSAVHLLIVLAASPLLLVMARIAWEVSALQNLCFVALLAVISSSERDAAPGPWSSLLFLYAAWLGMSSHFILLTALLAWLLGTLALLRSRDAARVAPWMQLSAAGVALGVGLYLVKPRLSPSHFAAHVVAYTLVWSTTPLAVWLVLRTERVGALSVRVARGIAPLVVRLFGPLLAVSGLWFMGSGLGLGLLDLMAGPVIYRGFAALALPTWLVITLYVLAAWALYLALRELVAVLRAPAHAADMGDQWLAAALAFWPLCLLLSGTFKTSMRYYLVIYPAWSWFLANRLDRARPRSALVVSWVASACACLLLWWPMAQGMQDPPQRFRMGNRRESAHHYLPLAGLMQRAHTERACHFEGDHFLIEPLRFLARVQPYPCDDARVLRVRYDLEAAPYWVAETKHRER
jgi:hypothetical protein